MWKRMRAWVTDTSLKDKVETVESIATTLAFLIAGYWTYSIFIKERKDFPHTNVEQKISHVVLPDKTKLLRVSVDVTNTGTSHVVLQKGSIWIQKIILMLPCKDIKSYSIEQMKKALEKIDREEDRFSWPLLAQRSKSFNSPILIEPGEKDSFDFEFAVPSDINVIRIYSYFTNERISTPRNESGWKATTFYKFD